jgi:hypothetical protein
VEAAPGAGTSTDTGETCNDAARELAQGDAITTAKPIPQIEVLTNPALRHRVLTWCDVIDIVAAPRINT